MSGSLNSKNFKNNFDYNSMTNKENSGDNKKEERRKRER